MSEISAQVSIYPLRQPDLSPTIRMALETFKKYSLDITPGPMSTLLIGAQSEIFNALQETFTLASQAGEVVMITTFSNACPVHEKREETNAITYQPIGYVENEFDETAQTDVIRARESRLVIDEQFAAGLKGLENRERILVLFDFHKSRGYELLQHPRGDKNKPQRGVFALHSPFRPNSIGATEVELLKIEGNVLYVRGLDAINRTPILDIKPL